MKLDILAMAAHPDDVELSCSGTLMAHIEKGYKVGIIDFTQGELGTRGTAETRKVEAEDAANILGVSVRENLKLADGFFTNDKEHQLKVIQAIRKYQPEMVICNAPSDRHPDHGKGAQLALDACFYSGLAKIQTEENGELQKPWRPKRIFHMIQSVYLEPDVFFDITPFWERKVKAIQAFKTQFFNPEVAESAEGDQTFISTPAFMQFLEARQREYGQAIGVKYAEGFVTARKMAVNNLFDIYNDAP